MIAKCLVIRPLVFCKFPAILFNKIVVLIIFDICTLNIRFCFSSNGWFYILSTGICLIFCTKFNFKYSFIGFFNEKEYLFDNSEKYDFKFQINNGELVLKKVVLQKRLKAIA